MLKQQNNSMQHQITAKNAQDFARVSERSKMTEEMMDDALGDAVSYNEIIGNLGCITIFLRQNLQFEDDEEEEDEVVSQVLGEIGIEASSQLPNAGTATAASSSTKTENEVSDADVDALLKQLEAS